MIFFGILDVSSVVVVVVVSDIVFVSWSQS